MRRRDLLKLGAYGVGAYCVGEMASGYSFPAIVEVATSPGKLPLPVIDTHIHLFDPTRAGGIPWPEKTDTILYKPAVPARYEAIARPFGVVGAIAIEASPRATDNEWLLDIAGHHPLMVGVIGDLVPGSPSYAADLERLHLDPLFLGFRYGNLWDRDLGVDLKKHGFLDGLKALARAGLVFETANPDANLIRGVVIIAERTPGLRIVIDHLPNAKLPSDEAGRAEYWANLRILAQSPTVFMKLSEIPVVMNGKPMAEVHFYEKSLDKLWGVFSEDRIIFGSDWPNSDHILPYAEGFKLVREYVSEKKPEVLEKFYWKNSIAAYQWKPRRPNQPRL